MTSGSDRRNRSGTTQPSQPFGNPRPDRTRGNTSQVYERYLTLAREAARSDDRVASENYYQHAEHYFRIRNAGRGANSAAGSQPIDQAAVETNLALTERTEIEDQIIPEPEA